MKRGRLAAYTIDGVLFLLGFLGFAVEYSEGKPSSTNFFGYILALLFLACGVIFFIGIRSCYRGGGWSFFGLLLVAAATAQFTSWMQLQLQGRQLLYPAAFCLTTAGLFGAGCYCLIWGHIRRQRRAPSQPVEATADPPKR